MGRNISISIFLVDGDLVKVNEPTCMDQPSGFRAWTTSSHGHMVLAPPYDPYGAYPVTPTPMPAPASIVTPSS